MPLETDNAPTWLNPKDIPLLAPADVHVWRIDLPVSPALFAICESAISPAEREQARRRKHQLSREHAILGRGVLRHLIAANTGLQPAAIEIVEGSHKKPQTGKFAFNIAHSGNVILIALQQSGSIGVDVEQINTTTPILEVAGKVYSHAEQTHLQSIADEALRRKAFFDFWTKKEAVVKADGRGLLLPLNSFDVTCTTVVFQHAISQPAGTNTFRLHPLPISFDYSAALATDQLSAIPKLFLYPGR